MKIKNERFFQCPMRACPLPHAVPAPGKVIARLVSTALTLAVNWISAEGHPFFTSDSRANRRGLESTQSKNTR